VWLVSGLVSNYAAEEEATVKTQKGLKFQVPEDWPIEERNGVVAPIPIEEYLDIKFKDIVLQLDALKKDLADKFEKLESDLEVVKSEALDKVAALGTRVDSLGEDAQGLSLDLDKLVARLNSIETGLKEISEESDSSQVNTGNIAQQLRNLDSRIKQLEEYYEDMKNNVAPEGEESWY
jgi:methyl-accepting chemotaxis protein